MTNERDDEECDARDDHLPAYSAGQAVLILPVTQKKSITFLQLYTQQAQSVISTEQKCL